MVSWEEDALTLTRAGCVTFCRSSPSSLCTVLCMTSRNFTWSIKSLRSIIDHRLIVPIPNLNYEYVYIFVIYFISNSFLKGRDDHGEQTVLPFFIKILNVYILLNNLDCKRTYKKWQCSDTVDIMSIWLSTGRFQAYFCRKLHLSKLKLARFQISRWSSAAATLE